MTFYIEYIEQLTTNEMYFCVFVKTECEKFERERNFDVKKTNKDFF